MLCIGVIKQLKYNISGVSKIFAYSLNEILYLYSSIFVIKISTLSQWAIYIVDDGCIATR